MMIWIVMFFTQKKITNFFYSREKFIRRDEIASLAIPNHTDKPVINMQLRLPQLGLIRLARSAANQKQ
jgi:hypothetical protein